MITVAELKAKSERKFRDFLKFKIESFFSEKADCLSEAISESPEFFPLEIRSDKGKTSDNLLAREKDFLPLIQSSKQKKGKGYSLVFEQKRTRNNGTQSQLSKILFETEEDFLSFIEKKSETKRLTYALTVIFKEFCPASNNSDLLGRWAFANVSYLTEFYDEKDFWENICLCVKWLLENPVSNLYIREIPLGVHTKFIENNKALILSLLICLKDDVQEEVKVSDFEKYCGLKEKPSFVRLRSLDKTIALKVKDLSISEVSLSLEDFEHFDKSEILKNVQKIFIIENEMVYLTFPPVENALCIWGHGFSVTSLKNCSWLKNHEVFYFGDLDEHGFLILSDFRKYFPNTKSFCMDKKTLDTFDSFRAEGKSLAGEGIPENLTEEEKALFAELRADKGRNRLEQERIALGYLKERLYIDD
ncbi:Wadjet anti-phage system protein JetD domain-containing protein [uncultured Treponema sp.]|uniref:Wadjet anti-phage system protein JetD domain-containing protein n=1 Tax=uncultured Treponema sp. TaxID=162155 RepID=UPI0025DEAFEA|nr:Wadjet anti-phage system protein JetD domain-containing protein [uncultured Treponema sp.]